MALRIEAWLVTVIDHAMLWWLRRSMSFQDQNPESARTVFAPVAPARLRRATSSSTKRTTPRDDPAEPFRIRAKQDLTGTGKGGQQRVIAQPFGVPLGGALFGFAVNFADRGIKIDHHRVGPGPSAELPGPDHDSGRHSIQLADMTEREGPQKRSDRGGCHHLEPQTPARLPRPAAC